MNVKKKTTVELLNESEKASLYSISFEMNATFNRDYQRIEKGYVSIEEKDLARKMGRSETAISRWTSGFPNLTLKSIAKISTALGEPLVKVTE